MAGFVQQCFVGLVIMAASCRSSSGASFDCGKARTSTEKLICSNPDLSKMDEVLAESYRKAREAAGVVSAQQQADLKEDQIGWIQRRAANCAEAGCLSNAYKNRIAVLDYYSQQAMQRKPGVTSLTGTYQSLLGELKVLSLPDDRIKFALDLADRDRIGSASGEVPLSHHTAVYIDPEDKNCKITLVFTGATVTAGQEGFCDRLFGLNITAKGFYLMSSTASPKFE